MDFGPSLSAEHFEALTRLETCLVANAIETFGVRLRNEGFADWRIRCMFPELPPMVGYAVTGRMRCSAPPIYGSTFFDRTDWWNYILSLPKPRVVVIRDIDPNPGTGAYVGEVHGSILRALGCVGYVTDGSVRFLPAARRAGFHLFAGGVSVSHAFAHLIDFGAPVEIGGLTISPGDLLHGDQHGLLRVPREVAAEIPQVAAKIVAGRRKVMAYCASADFTVDGLRELIKETK